MSTVPTAAELARLSNAEAEAAYTACCARVEARRQEAEVHLAALAAVRPKAVGRLLGALLGDGRLTVDELLAG